MTSSVAHVSCVTTVVAGGYGLITRVVLE